MSLDQKNLEILAQVGQNALAREQWDIARMALKQVWKQSPANVAETRQLFEQYVEACSGMWNDIDEEDLWNCILYLNDVIPQFPENDPRKLTAQINRTMAYYRVHKLEEAAFYSIKILEDYPTEPNAYALRSAMQSSTNDLVGALNTIIEGMGKCGKPISAQLRAIRATIALMQSSWPPEQSILLEYEERLDVLDPEMRGRPTFWHPRMSVHEVLSHPPNKKLIDLLLVAEQGFGDSIMMLRYARQLHAAYPLARIGAYVPVVLARLFSQQDVFAEVYPAGIVPVPNHRRFVPMMSLPHRTLSFFNPHVTTFIRADPKQSQAIRKEIDTIEYNVGFCWRGGSAHQNDAVRSLTRADALDAVNLLRERNVDIYSLFPGDDKDPLPGVDFIPMSDFSVTAAIIDNLDAVITVDTAVAHLAASMKKRVYMLCATPADWRWGQSGNRTPWYPTMQIFRAARPRSWAQAISELFAAFDDDRKEIKKSEPIDTLDN